MSRPPRAVDEALTLEIGIDELEIVDYKDGQYVAINVDHEVPVCPKCGNRCINHKLRKRLFADYIQDESGKGKLVYLRYDQYMYRCQNKSCRHLFAKDISFARKNSKVTKRFERQIAKMALSKSYGEIKGRFGDNLARSTIKDILERWTEWHDQRQGALHTPKVLCIFSLFANGIDYLVFADGEEERKLIIEILPNYTSTRIVEMLYRFDMTLVEEIVVEPSQELITVLRDYFPDIELQVHSKGLLKAAKIDFLSIIQEDGLYIRNQVKKNLLKSPDNFLFKEGSDDLAEEYNRRLTAELGGIKKATEDKPRINAAYELFLELHKVLLPESDLDAVTEWRQKVQLAATYLEDAERTIGFLHEDDFGLTLGYIKTYLKELMNFYLRRTVVTQEIYDQLIELNDMLNRFNTYSDESLRCKILYLAEPVLEVKDGIKYWYGVPVNSIKEKIENLK